MLYPPDSHCRISRPQVQEALKLRRLADTGAGFGSHFWFRNSTVRMRRHSPPRGRHGSDANHGQVGNCDAPALAVYMVGTRVKHAPWVGPGPGDVARQNEGAGCPLFRCSVRTPAPPPQKNEKRSNGHFMSSPKNSKTQETFTQHARARGPADMVLCNCVKQLRRTDCSECIREVRRRAEYGAQMKPSSSEKKTEKANVVLHSYLVQVPRPTTPAPPLPWPSSAWPRLGDSKHTRIPNLKPPPPGPPPGFGLDRALTVFPADSRYRNPKPQILTLNPKP